MIARGCSTKDKLYHVECENHVMGKTVRTTETFCYCSYSFCNSRAGRLGEKYLRSSNEESLYFVSEGSSSNTVIVTACLTIIIPLNRLLSTLS